MTPLPTSTFWLQTLASLALQTAAVLAVAGLASRLLRTPRSQRATWVAAFAGLALVSATALLGLDRPVTRWYAPAREPSPRFIVRNNLPAASPSSPISVLDAALHGAGGEPDAPRTPSRPDAVRWWPAWLWLAGSLAVAAWAALPRCWLAALCRARPGPDRPAHQTRLDALARQLGLRQRVRLLESPRLAGPIAFGVLRPTIGVPADFWTAHSASEQDAMLAHECAHLTARDPLWLALADTLATVLWWHPLVWWARRQFRAASEAAADEASLVVEDGPAVLAGCLVALATRWQRRGALGLLGMAGFRSGLGRRVERLLHLDPSQLPFRRSRWQRPLLLAAIAAIVAASPSIPLWLLPAHAQSQPSLLAVVGQALAASPATPAAAPTGVGEPSPAAAASPAQPVAPDAGSDNAARAEFSVQLPAVPGLQPEAVRRLAMDAVTRRLGALPRFRDVRCEPEGPDRLRITLALRDTDAAGTNATADLWPVVTRLIEQKGQLAFRRVHPESDDLLARNECPDGYKVLAQSAGPGEPVRRLIVARDAAPGLGSSNVVESVVRGSPPDNTPRIAIAFDEAGAKAFADLTQASLGQKIAVVLDDTLLMAPVVRSAILGGKCEITGRFTEEEAAALAAALAHPLPGPLTIRTQSLPATSAAAPDTVSLLVDEDGNILWNGKAIAPDRIAGELGRAKAETSDLAVRLTGSESPRSRTAAMNLIALCQQAGITRISVHTLLESPTSRPTPAPSAPPASSPGASPAPATPALAAPEPLLTRTYRVNPQSLTQGLAALGGSVDTNLPPAEMLRRLFAAAGGPWGETNVFPGGSAAGPFQTAQGRALFFKDQEGLLLARATAKELETIEQVLQLVNATPSQVVIEAKFIEITGEDTQTLGFDWYLGNVPMGAGGVTPTGSSSATNPPGAATGVFPAAAPTGGDQTTGSVATLTGLLSDSQFREVTAALARSPSNAVREVRGSQLDWPGRGLPNASNITVSAALGSSLTGVLTDPQARVVLRALEQRSGVDVLSAPKVTTLSGRQAQIQLSDIRTILTGLNPAALQPPGITATSNVTAFTMVQLPVGPTLDVIPTVAADGTSIHLTVIPTLTEFLGYDAPPKDARVRVWEGGKARLVDPPLPRFRMRQMQTQAQIKDGQTLVLRAFPVEDTLRTKDKVPVLGDLPLAGGLFRSESRQTVRKTLLVLITATIIDAAGNPVHTAPNVPAPFQPAPQR